MLTQHEIFVFAAFVFSTVVIKLRIDGVTHRGDLLLGAFACTGVSLLGLLTVLELVFWLVGPLRR